MDKEGEAVEQIDGEERERAKANGRNLEQRGLLSQFRSSRRGSQVPGGVKRIGWEDFESQPEMRAAGPQVEFFQSIGALEVDKKISGGTVNTPD